LHDVASLAIRVWAETFIIAAHTLNVLPTSVLSERNPYEMFFNSEPDYTKFKVFGYACYPLLCPYNRHKLDFRSTCCLFLGYSLHNKEYICLSRIGKTFSCHVIFNEDIFPIHFNNNFTNAPDNSVLPSDNLLSLTVLQHVLILILLLVL